MASTGLRPAGACWTFDADKDGKWSWHEHADRDWRNPGFAQTDRDPAVCVSAQDADAYARWLSAKTGQQYRLPSEAEWEYAARAGTTTARFWGDDRDTACRYANVADDTLKQRIGTSSGWQFFSCTDGFVFTAPVGSFDANPFGLYDMLGNVWQWSADPWHGSYNGASDDGSVWITGGDAGRRVVRGGAWINYPTHLRAGVRYGYVTGNRYGHVGFRLARTLSPP